jgi:galactoside O-acetyltransferase
MGEHGFLKCGEDVRISGDVVFKHPELVELGSHVAIDGPCYFSTAMSIGDYVHIAPFCSVIGGASSRLEMGDFSGLSAGCRVVCGSDDYKGSGLTNPTVPARFHAALKTTTVRIGRHAVIGTSCVIHPGVTIGEGAALGSCTLVTKDLQAWGVYLGMPARMVEERPREAILEMERLLRLEEGRSR